MATGGIGLGGQIFVIVLNSDAVMKTFVQSRYLTLGRNVSVALGPWGRSSEIAGAVGSQSMVGMFAYSKTGGKFGGRSFKGGIIGQRLETNKKMYGAELTAKQLLSGKISSPPEAEPLMRLLNSEQFYAQPGVSSMDALPTPYQQLAELPAALPNEPNGSPNGNHELDTELPLKVAELGSGPQNTVYKMLAGQNGRAIYELDASQPLTQEQLSAKSPIAA
ncbi:hypothetical protein N7448_010483 [Penicillium atrosanguineum]|uniref:Ysc84 actin-binding domain-containing protein n=1 Tax=Penicillium atrosanguineum TaxID=1132637 RepID=A0A9W9PNX7_9EURO|nr:Tubulin binding cofactor C [Penicillium atrosanguineum]KAJ5118775.1 hypothetical protein N7526_010412 [Penicillium atrosanguineum]KAJ5119814.1 hypothetical protein N7448_010483 [Penicillium atrosanguineum]KAJ5296814.1 Tubulin binding cofactor C [Penicillium atrosanguineum]KAJ5299574.1 hypothetical protein N7476_011131 [Penicillium atrosanguineum]